MTFLSPKTVVIPAAGEGTRLRSDSEAENLPAHKTLIKIGRKTLLYRILEALIDVGINRVVIIGGDNYQILSNFINTNDFRYILENIDLRLIKANTDYKKGPLLTLLGIKPLIHRGFNLENFLLIPSDTYFHPVLLREICQPNAEEDIFGILFGLEFGADKKIKTRIIRTPSDIPPPIQNNIFNKKKGREILIPAVILKEDFLRYAGYFVEKGIVTVIECIRAILEKGYGRFMLKTITVSGNIIPFADVDTYKDYIYIQRNKELLGINFKDNTKYKS